MALLVFKISEYDHQAEIKQFDQLCAVLGNIYKTQDSILIGNFNIEGVELDALLITPGGIRILEFKNWGGKIIARENGSWTADGMIIEGGALGKTPFTQIRLNRSRVTKGIKNLLDIDSPYISAAVIFYKNSIIDSSQLSDTVKKWLHVVDNAHLIDALTGLDQHLFNSDFLKKVPSRLGIEEFSLSRKEDLPDLINEIYEPEVSTVFFEELENALVAVPDYAKVYSIFSRVFQKSLDQKINATKLNFSGTFAKTDYLLKEYQASRPLVQSVNDTRSRLRKRSELSDYELKENYLYDLKNICKFIAFIYKVSIPDYLSALFPKIDKVVNRRTLIKDCMRVVVDKWDDNYVYVQSEDADEILLKVCYVDNNPNNGYNQGNWSYLKELFYKDAQMNLIRPRVESDIIYPELIIFEPDYLVDISSISRCFAHYSESHFVNMINRIEPSQPTEAMVLGNFAGQLLDECIHQLPNSHSYNQSVMDFFRNNAISLLSANPGVGFHDEAKRQKINIHNAINVALPSALGHFDSKEGMVEPSFFSEMLGIQGRMDYLQSDFRVLMEQKSGKGEWPFNNFIRPTYKEEHYVQLLLYMNLIRYNYREIYDRNNKELHAFLLYTKYQESLDGHGFAPQLLFRALKIRNGIAWADILFTKPNVYRILDSLTPEKLNTKQVSDNLWNNYQYPHLQQLLNPIHYASELEKAYYFRFLTFIANEHMLSKLGNKTKDNSGFASKWHDSLEDKLLAGNIYDRLSLYYPNSETVGQIKDVVLTFSETPDNDMANFRVGDIVVLYAYDESEEPDVRKSMVYRCSIKDINNDTITLELRAPQSDNRVFMKDRNKLWAIEHDFMESSYSSLYKGMHAFLSAPKERRDLLLLQREPRVDTSVTLKGNYSDNFNELVLRVKQAQDLFLIIGPPGTGKTSIGLLDTVKEELEEPESSILLLSYTNRAVDEICDKLYENGIDFIRIGGELNCSETHRDNLLSSKVITANNVNDLRNVLATARVIVSTTTSLNSHISLLDLKQFSLAVIDEASQILEPHLIGILSANKNGIPAIRKIVMIGDHKQLPAVVQQKKNVSIVREKALNDIFLSDCSLSLFERLLKKYDKKNKKVTYLLNRQGRMHHDIAIFPNYTFYNNELKEVPTGHQEIKLPIKGNGINGITDLLTTRRVVFIASDAPDNSPSDKVNQNEAEIIAATVVKIYELERATFDVNSTVGVIVPYRNQIAAVRKTIDRYGISILHDITIDTVERYQGSQRQYIIYGFTIQKYYQLNFLTSNVFLDTDGTIVDRKLNVAITRAREHLILVGNPSLLANNFTYVKLLEFVRSKQGYFTISTDDYVKGNFQVPEYEQIEDWDLNRATYTTSSAFDKVFEKFVISPIMSDERTEWPYKIFGNDMTANLNAIGYGRINFTNQLNFLEDYTPERQVLVYCYYIMRQHYCSSINIYNSYKPWIESHINSVKGRVHMIDIGCGPATCGLAFSEVFLDVAPNMVYTGIDVSAAMKKMGKNLLNNLHNYRFRNRMISSFNELDKNFWDGCSELPSLIIFNISYFFSNVSQKFTEELATQIRNVMNDYPLNKYIFIIQHSEIDRNLESFKVFRKVLEQNIVVQKREKDSFSYQLNYKERRLEFCYDIYTSK